MKRRSNRLFKHYQFGTGAFQQKNHQKDNKKTKKTKKNNNFMKNLSDNLTIRTTSYIIKKKNMCWMMITGETAKHAAPKE